MTLRVYTDVTGMRPQTRMGGLLNEAEWAPLGTNSSGIGAAANANIAEEMPGTGTTTEDQGNGSDGTRTRGLRRDRPAL
jgi:hypothetical protein